MRWLVALLAVVPMQVSALSCLRPSVERAFTIANDVDEIYIVVSGRLGFDPSDWPIRDKSMNNKPDVDVPAVVNGTSLGRRGFVTPFKSAITLNAQCFGPWCGQVTHDQDYLFFLRRTDSGYVQDVDPCGATLFADPTPAQLRSVQNCLNGVRCDLDTSD